MTGGTLILTRSVNLHSYYKMRFEELGFRNVTVSASERGELDLLIREMKPSLVIIDFMYYDCCTPFMAGLLLVKHPGLNLAAVTQNYYPADTALCFINYGIKSCIYYHDGREQFYRGLDLIRSGVNYVSPSIKARYEYRRKMPKPTKGLSPRQLEVAKLLCNGFSIHDIAIELEIRDSTVNNIKTEIFNAFNIKSSNEIIRTCIFHKIVGVDELCFFPRGYVPRKRIKKSKKKELADDY